MNTKKIVELHSNGAIQHCVVGSVDGERCSRTYTAKYGISTATASGIDGR